MSECDFARVYVDYFVDSDHTRLHVVNSSVDDALAEIIARKQHDSILSHASDYKIERFALERCDAFSLRCTLSFDSRRVSTVQLDVQCACAFFADVATMLAYDAS